MFWMILNLKTAQFFEMLKWNIVQTEVQNMTTCIPKISVTPLSIIFQSVQFDLSSI